MSKRILVIEDQESFRNILKEVLEDYGYEVEVSPFLASAVGQALSGSFDLVTLDLNMPGLDGVEIAQLFQHRNLNTPILIISGYLNQSVKSKLKEWGVRHFLDKPSGIPQIIQAVEQTIGYIRVPHAANND